MGTPIPFTPCDDSPQAWAVNSVTIEPDPPTAGQRFTIVLAGSMSVTVTQGAKCTITGKLGDAVFLSLTEDLCTLGAKQGRPCPIPPGPDWALGFPIDLPSVPPFVSLNFRFQVTNADGSPITCLDTTVMFQP